MDFVPEREGVVKDEKTGELYIPATRRPDGTWRKPRKVKDGYVPQEEVPVYENRGVQWMKSRPTLPPGLNPDDVEATKKSDSQPMSKSAKKNAKRKEKKKQQQESGTAGRGESVDNVTQTLAASKISEDSQKQAPPSDKAAIEKKLRNLRKKLKQVDDLKAKIDSGELKSPEKEQLAKVAKRQELVDEIEDLELDLED
ncbi:partner of Y14 and mago-like [Saccostrea echinata]|uniref:partner of Y14 and mago-like n=1 Tax=Saccostrea echinata TaxID=191078 RepID=UPI002A83FBC3|nr:partner of Y14 and mago-like [Saccostrea echinata]